MENQDGGVSLNDINGLQGLEILYGALDKANEKGCFKMKEAFAYQIAFDKVASEFTKMLEELKKSKE